jgi:hypothetical protein
VTPGAVGIDNQNQAHGERIAVASVARALERLPRFSET